MQAAKFVFQGLWLIVRDVSAVRVGMGAGLG
jgi:hypothetical protein